MQLHRWTTRLKAGDVITVGTVVIHVRYSASGELRVTFELPETVKITKRKAAR